MTKETILNQYAKKQGYESWEILCLNYIRTSNDRIICHINAVTDLIQEELLKKVSEIAETTDVITDDYQGYGEKTYITIVNKQSILNTEIL